MPDLSALAKPFCWIASFFDPKNPNASEKTAGMALATLTLCWTAVRMTRACSALLDHGGHLTPGDVAGLAMAIVPLASLAGCVYLIHPDGTIDVGPAPHPPSLPPVRRDEGVNA